MARPRHSSRNITRILGDMLADPAAWRHGYGISQRLGIAPGSLYPALARLSDDGLLEARWELPTGGGQPRHLYRLTAEGVEFAHSSMSMPGRPVTGNDGRTIQPAWNPT